MLVTSIEESIKLQSDVSVSSFFIWLLEHMFQVTQQGAVPVADVCIVQCMFWPFCLKADLLVGRAAVFFCFIIHCT